MNVAPFPEPSVKSESDLSPEERGAWQWMMSATTFDATLVNLTPALAQLLISRVGENRKPRRATIERYARLMKVAQWKLTHQGIAISTRFEVIDGQHRLHAVVESNVTIEVLVVRGVSQDAMLVIDGGVLRTDAEAIRIYDFGLRDLEKIDAASARRMLRGTRRSMRSVSREDLRQFILRHREPIRSVRLALFKHGRVPNVTNAEIIAVLARANYHCTRDDLMAAIEFLSTGKSDNERLEPLLILREWLLRASRRELGQRYGKAERAMRAFIDNEKLGRRLIETREELFSLPEERDDDET